jgi:hypothetical protein
MLCVLVHCERLALNRPNISVLSLISQRTLIGIAKPVFKIRRKQISFGTFCVAMAYTVRVNRHLSTVCTI